MAQEWYFYIDWGSGDTLLNPANVALKPFIETGVINDAISRKGLEGSFDLVATEFDTANTYFNTNGNYEAVFKLYENGIKGVGVLQFNGLVRTNGNWDFRNKTVTFDNFKINDQYTELLAKLNNKFEGEVLTEEAMTGSFAAQGQNANANKLFNFTWTNPSFTLVAGTPLSIPNLGRCASAHVGGEIVLADNVNNTLNSYIISGSQWSLKRTYNLGSGTLYSAFSMTRISTTRLSIVYTLSNGSGYIDTYAFSGTTTFTLISSFRISRLKFPSICWTGARVALVDEEQKTIRVAGAGNESSSLSLGDIRMPQICLINSANETIAFIDTKQGKLQTYRYVAGVFTAIGNALGISGLVAPTMIQENNPNQLILHDAVLGSLRYYSFDGTNWSQTGNSYSIGGGYMSSICSNGVNISLAISDTFIFSGSVSTPYKGLINSLLFKNDLFGGIAGKYELQSSGNGATMDVDKIVIGSMADISDNQLDAGDLNKYKFSLKEALGYWELFQNSWYIEDGAGVTSHKIKFKQPINYSATGTDINISVLQAATELNQRVYNDNFRIDQEEIIFNNINSLDFDGNVIDYSRNTPIIESKIWPFTTDLEYLVKIFTGQISAKINTGGLIMYYRDSTSSPNIAASGTGIISGTDTKNYKLSQSQIMNDFYKDYRYSLGDTANNQITINGSVIATPSTVRNIIEYKEVVFSENDVSITQFPSSVASLIWGGGIPKSFITKLVYDIDSRQYTAFSRRLDI